MLARTDLAIELKNNEKNLATEEKSGEYIINKIRENNNTHITITLPNLLFEGGAFNEAEEIISKQISSLLPKSEGTVLVVGLGNRDITPDAIGPLALNRIVATRHISKELARQINLPSLRSVAAIAPSVLGSTGIEVAEIAAALSSTLEPKAIIAVDALCAADIKRLGTTVQISNAGISPGSGVKNSRSEISEKTLGIPVIAVGFPTVIDASALLDTPEPFIVTPKDIDLLIDRAATLIANSLNIALQPETEPEVLRALV